MTRTELDAWQRRFEWALMREAAQGVAAHRRQDGHDLLGQIQIVDLVSQELGRHCATGAPRELVDDLQRAALHLRTAAHGLLGIRVPAPTAVARVAPILAAAIARVRPVITATLDVHGDVGDIATCCPSDELEHLVVGLVLDLAEAPRIELHVRTRTIEGLPWLELVRGSETVTARERHELRIVEVIAARAGGEVARSERRGGGEELVIALRVVADPVPNGR